MVFKRFVLFLTALLIISSITYAEGNFNSFELIDGANGEKFDDVIVYLTAEGEKTKVVLAMNGTLVLDIKKSAEIVIDFDAAEGVDYYYSGFPEASGLHFYPIAKVRGNVYDAVDNLIMNADMDFDCDTPLSILFPEKTDKYGGFSSYLPLGRCVIIASDGEMLGQKEIISEQGAAYTLDIQLDQPLHQVRSFYWIIAVLIVLALIFLGYKKFYRMPTLPQKKIHDKKIQLPAVLKTLNEKEKNLVEYLLQHNHKANAAQVRHELQIPKTSFMRILARLEGKKIITLERNGSFIIIKLADWLLQR